MKSLEQLRKEARALSDEELQFALSHAIKLRDESDSQLPVMDKPSEMYTEVETHALVQFFIACGYITTYADEQSRRAYSACESLT